MTAAPPPIGERRASAVGAALVALGPISMALYTPAMPTLVVAFDTSMAAVKATLTAYFAGFALAQLAAGPLSDAYGRRPVLTLFLLVYVVASIAAALAPTVEWLIVARLAQGIGAAAGISLSRAIVRDGFTGQASARIMNTIGIWLAIGPAVSPTLGGLILAVANWHGVFVAMVAYGAVLLLVVRTLLPETNRSPDPAKAAPRRLAVAYARLLADLRFLRPSLVVAFTVGGLYALGTMLPFVLIDRVGLTPTAFGVGMLMQTGSYAAGGFAAKLLLRRVDARRLTLPGLLLCASGGVMMAISAQLFAPSFLSVMLPVAVFAFSLALVMPASTTDALAPFPDRAGAAAALMGFLQMGCGFAGSLVAATMGDAVLAFGTVVPAMTVAGLLLALLVKPRDLAEPLR